jgi:hypothetical protein
MLRKTLLWHAAVLIVGGVPLSIEGSGPSGRGLLGIGVVLLLALLIERCRYKQIVDTAPCPQWQPTGERFIEPGTDGPVAVYADKTSGKRLYVRTSANMTTRL